MTITIDENQDLEGVEFTPFNETVSVSGIERIGTFVSTGSLPRGTGSADAGTLHLYKGYDTSQIDSLRQGVSLKTTRQVYGSIQPKIWAGNLKHFILVRTIGQARSFTEYFETPLFVDILPTFDTGSIGVGRTPAHFNPVQYLTDPNYPHPILFNNGPQQEEEAIIEPLTIPFRKTTTEGNILARGVKGSLEDGNNFDQEDGASNRIEQFKSFTPPSEPRFFLDEGAEYIGGGLYSNLLDETFDPIVLYQLNKRFDDPDGLRTVLFRDSIGNGVDLGSTSVRLSGEGPFPTTVDNPKALIFDGSGVEGVAGVSSNLEAYPGIDMTVEFFYYFDSTSSGIDDLFGYGSNASSKNIQFGLRFTSPGPQFLIQHTKASDGLGENTTINFSGSLLNLDGWNHIVMTREAIAANQIRIRIWVNGFFIGEDTSLEIPIVVSNYRWSVGNDYTSFNAPLGRMSSFKVIPQVLSTYEIRQEYFRLFNPRLRPERGIPIENFIPVIQREIVPYNETKDERIVDRIRTTDTVFISALKALKFDLDDDIRESFDKKSATAGNDVYGPDAGYTGTDSITFVGRTRGA